LATSVALLHAPPPELPAAALQTRSHPAWRRIKFDELLAQQLSLRRAYLARRTRGAPVLLAAGELGRRLKASLPFALTGAQQRVAAEIAADLEQPYPMQRCCRATSAAARRSSLRWRLVRPSRPAIRRRSWRRPKSSPSSTS
jgi:ATP-dependent DNA helicase RecG